MRISRANKILFFILVFILLVKPYSLFSQNDTIPRYYKDSLGRLFIAPGTPVQLFIGTSTDKSNTVLLKSFPDGSDKIYWSGHGPKHISHYNSYSGKKFKLDLFVDGNAPKSNVDFVGNKIVEKDNVSYISGTCFIELHAKDPDAGTNLICYSINNDVYKEYSKPIELKAPGKHTIAVYSVDNVGNTEDEVTKTLMIDNTPPITEIVFEGDNYNEVLSGRSKINFKSADDLGVESTYWSIDGGKETYLSKPISVSALAEGEHSISWYSIDIVNNTERTKSFDFYVDKTPPMVFEEIVGNSYMVAGKEYSSGRSQLKVVAVDNKAGIKEIHFALNNKEYQQYEKPVYLSDILGSVKVQSYALDNVNNKSVSATESQSFTMPEIDITGPNLSYSFDGLQLKLRDTVMIGPTTKIHIKANDFGAGVHRIIIKPKGQQEWDYSEPFTINHQGFQEIICSAFDNVENINLINFSFFVDAEAPKIFHHFSTKPASTAIHEGKNIYVYNSNTVLYLGSTDNISGIKSIEYSINDSQFRKYLHSINTFKPNSIYSLKVKALDLLGNESSDEITFKIE